MRVRANRARLLDTRIGTTREPVKQIRDGLVISDDLLVAYHRCVTDPAMASLRMELRLPDERVFARPEGVRTYDEELDDIGSILSDVCELVCRTPGAAFVVSGFGDDAWPTSADRELCLLLEQLPAIARALRERTNAFELSFFEQGCYRILTFEARGDLLAVTCASGDAWQPPRDEVLMPAHELQSMLAEVLATFLSFAAATCPAVVAHPRFEQWQRDAHPS